LDGAAGDIIFGNADIGMQ